MKQSTQKRVKDRGFVRHGMVADRVRRAIVDGRHTPGSKLPPHLELQRTFRTTPVTVQRALDQLRDEGFIRTNSNRGTYVTDHPPSMYRYALVLNDHPPRHDLHQWSRHLAALSAVARRVNKLGPRKVELYYDINAQASSADFHRLTADIASRRVAGVMFANYPHDVWDTPAVQTPGVPRVVPSDPGDSPRRSIPWVGLDFFDCVAASLRWIADRGRRNVGVITVPFYPQAGLQDRINEAGLTCRPFWMQAVEPHHTEWVRHAVHAILHSEPSVVPDALYVTDDHLVEAVADALIEFGVRVPDDMLVVGHWNFPLEFTRDLPVQLIGRDNTEFLRHWVACIDAQRAGESVPMATTLQVTVQGETPLTDPVEVQRLPAPVVGHL